MKKCKKSAASMLLLLLMVSVAACGRNNGTAADENAGTGNEAGVENNSGNTGLDGRPFDEILFDTDGVEDVVDGGENGTDGTGNVDNNAAE